MGKKDSLKKFASQKILVASAEMCDLQRFDTLTCRYSETQKSVAVETCAVNEK
jgi:hypothetical protein